MVVALAMTLSACSREAEAHLAREMKFMERYAHGVPDAAPLLAELRLALPTVHRPWRERPAPALAHLTKPIHGG